MLALYIINDGTNKLAVILRGSTSGTTELTSTSIRDSKWHHIAITWNGTNAYAYLDGGSPISLNVGTNAYQDRFLSIGSAADGTSTSRYNGLVDEVKLWNRALSASEVLVDYNSFV